MCKSLLDSPAQTKISSTGILKKKTLGKLKVSSTGALLKWCVKKSYQNFFQHLKCRHFHLSNTLLIMSLAYLWPEIDTKEKMWILIPVLPLSKFDTRVDPTLLLDCTKSFLNRQNTSSQKFLNRQNFLSSPNILSSFCHFLGPPEYSDELEFSPPEYSDDVEFSDISACWFWTKKFLTKKLLL